MSNPSRDDANRLKINLIYISQQPHAISQSNDVNREHSEISQSNYQSRRLLRQKVKFLDRKTKLILKLYDGKFAPVEHTEAKQSHPHNISSRDELLSISETMLKTDSCRRRGTMPMRRFKIDSLIQANGWDCSSIGYPRRFTVVDSKTKQKTYKAFLWI